MMERFERFYKYMKFRGLNDNQVTVQCELSQGLIGKCRAGKQDLGSKTISKLLTKYQDLNKVWLLTGEGDMIKSQEGDIYINDRKKEVSIVPLYDGDVSAGLQKFFEGGGRPIGNISIPNMPGADGAMHVTGDSMYPLINPGDIIAYRVLHDTKNLIYGQIYILQLEHDDDIQVVLKYVRKSEKDGCVLLASYNKEHDPMDVPMEWITVIARVAFSVRKYTAI